MRNGRTALPVLLGIVAFAIAAFHSLFVEGVTSGPAVPGMHPTTEVALPSLSFESGVDAGAAAALPETEKAQPVKAVHQTPAAEAAEAVRAESRDAASVKREARPDGVPAGYVYWKTIRAKVTAYEPSWRSCGKYADGKTSIGENAWVLDGVAADPKAIPYGTWCMVPGVGAREVDDTGSAMRDSWREHRRYHLDVRMASYSKARKWGVKELEVKLYRKAK